MTIDPLSIHYQAQIVEYPDDLAVIDATDVVFDSTLDRFIIAWSDCVVQARSPPFDGQV